MKRHFIFTVAIWLLAVQSLWAVTIRFNSSTGSDTTASGSAGAIVANGTNASFSGSVVTLDGSPDLSGFDADEDVLWMLTSTGRQFFDLSAVDNSAKTVTTVNAPSGTSTGRTWAIGGKRQYIATTNSKRLWDNGGSAGDIKSGWVAMMESGHTETISATFDTRTGTLPVYLIGEPNAATMPVLTFSNNGQAITMRGGYQTYAEFEIRNSNATKTASIAFQTGSAGVGNFIHRIKCDHSTDNFWKFFNSASIAFIKVDRCSIGNCASVGIDLTQTQNCDEVTGCWIRDCGSHGITMASVGYGCIVQGNIIESNGGSGIYDATTRPPSILDNIFYNNAASGIYRASPANEPLSIRRNIFVSNGAYGIDCEITDAALREKNALVRSNAHYNNTSGWVTSGITLDTDTTALSADPFVNAAAGDFNLNDTAGGGAALRAANVMVNADTSLFPFRNFVSDDFGGAGTTTIIQQPYLFP